MFFLCDLFDFVIFNCTTLHLLSVAALLPRLLGPEYGVAVSSK